MPKRGDFWALPTVEALGAQRGGLHGEKSVVPRYNANGAAGWLQTIGGHLEPARGGTWGVPCGSHPQGWCHVPRTKYGSDLRFSLDIARRHSLQGWPPVNDLAGRSLAGLVRRPPFVAVIGVILVTGSENLQDRPKCNGLGAVGLADMGSASSRRDRPPLRDDLTLPGALRQDHLSQRPGIARFFRIVRKPAQVKLADALFLVRDTGFEKIDDAKRRPARSMAVRFGLNRSR